MYVLASLIAFGLFAALAWRSRPLALALLAAVLPSYLLRGTLAGIPFTWLEVFSLILIAVWIVKGEIKRAIQIPRPWLIVSTGLLAAAFVATFIAPDTREALGILKAYFIEPIAVFLVGVTTLKRPQDIHRLVTGLLAGAAAASLVALFQYLTGLGLPIPWDAELRATGPFPYPNALALYAGPIAVLGAWESIRMLNTHGWHRAWPWFVETLLAITGVILAQSEAGIGALLIVLFVSALALPKLRPITIGLAALGLVGVLLIPSLQSFVVQKATLNDYSGMVRRSQWEETWAMIKDRPVFGAGLNGYPAALMQYHVRTDLEIFQYPHTLLLNVWSELGLLGLLVLIGLAYVVGNTAHTAWKNRAHTDPFLLAMAFAALAQMTIQGFVDVPYFKNDLALLTWLILALIALAPMYGSPSSKTTEPS